MRTALTQALVTLVIFLATLGALIGGAIYYHAALILVAASLAVGGYALLMGLIVWGLTLARQQDDLASGPDLSTGPSLAKSSPFRMSYGDDAPVTAVTRLPGAPEARSLDVGFQRVVVALSAVTMLGLAGAIAYLAVTAVQTNTRPGQEYGFAAFDQLAAVIALGAVGAFYALQRYTRATAKNAMFGEAAHGIVTIGLPAMAAVAAAVLAEWAHVRFAAETGAGVVAFLLMLLGVELLVNAARSYAAVEEIDQPPVDLTALPLVPMLSSVWLSAVQSLLAQSLGLARYGPGTSGEPTIVSRMMPRVLMAMVVLLFLTTMLRTVNPGEVAILERLGQAQTEADPAHPGQRRLVLLAPGLHFTLPWPIDDLVHIPTQTVQEISIGTEEEPLKINGQRVPLDFAFWSFRHAKGVGGLDEYDFYTGDQQVLGTLGSVWWRVKDPAAFYENISHSAFYEAQRQGGKDETVARPVYVAMVESMATQAITLAFAQHPLDVIMETNRHEVEEQCQRILQEHLDGLHSGIEIVDFTIREVHPPVGQGVTQTATGEFEYGPAAAYERVVSAREEKEQWINEATATRIRTVNAASGAAASALSDALAYKNQRIAAASGEVLRQGTTAPQYVANPELARSWFIYKSLDDLLPNPKIIKVILGKDVQAPEIIQPNKEGAVPIPRPPGAGP